MPAGPVNGLPFTAVVGMDDAKRALECAIVSPSIRTVLLRGGEGTAKTVLARAAAGLTGKKLVNCPLNVTEEQLFGGLDVEETVRTGVPAMEKGLLSRADGNILYIDDINLMDRGMLAGIMDAVLTGTVRVERGAVSGSYPCDTTLIATMNPDDSDLSDHVLDRFDLCAYSSDCTEEERKLIVSRNAELASDPEGLAQRFAKSQEEESAKVSRAALILPMVTVSDELISVVCELCQKVGAEGSRGDIAMVECAEAIAALNGRDSVMKKDVEEAAVLCLPHRRNYDQPPPEPPQEQQIQQDEGDEQDDRENSEGQDDRKDGEEPPQDSGEQPRDQQTQQDEGDEQDDDDHPQDGAPDIGEMLFEIGRQFRVIDYLDSRERVPSRTKARKGRRAVAISADGTGRYARARISSGHPTDIAFDATIRAAAPYQRERHRDGMSIAIEDRDIREKVRERRSGATLLFLVDASGSLGVRKRMAAVKGAVLSMLRDSYVRRDRIGLMAFRRSSAEMILPPTRSVEYSYRKLEDLPTGGKTPLGEALMRAEDYMTSYARCHIGERCFIVLVTDGRANVPMAQGADANAEALKTAENLRIPGVRWIVVDAGAGFPHFDNAEKLAAALEARYFRLEDLDADRLAEGVRAAVG
ncbi:MAG: VWA domain-containing protein [Candidatus Methanomethylophilus sp.]|nr:VWA domain-containing protein [Methanomethylophilus sp.]MCI2093757.1 VWA domain-containing protein [Methanomethylophilus sp.]